MFKRMMGSFGYKRPERDAAALPSAAASRADFITTCDANGRAVRVRRTTWRDSVLLPGIEKAWNDPEALYVHLVTALDHRFAADLDAASIRLLAIDPSPQRAQAVRSIVLMETGRKSDRQRRATGPPPHAASGQEADTVGLDRPVWSYGLRNPTWLLAEKSADAPLVTFVAFAGSMPPGGPAHARYDDETGSLSRSAALYLAEAVHQWTDLRTATVIPVVEGSGPLVLDAGAQHADLCARFGEESAYLVSGVVDRAAGGWRIACRLWDCARRAHLAEDTIEVPAGGVGAALPELERRLLARLGGARAAPVDAFYARPTRDAMAPYLAALGDAFMLTLVANAMMPRDLPAGERALLERLLRTARQWPAADVPKLMLLSGLAKAAAYGSGVVHEFQSRTLELMRDAGRTGSAVARMEPLALQVFGRREELARHEAALGPDTPYAYRQWLARRVAETGSGEPSAFAAH